MIRSVVLAAVAAASGAGLLAPSGDAGSKGEVRDRALAAGVPVIGPDIVVSRVASGADPGPETSAIAYWDGAGAIAAYAIATTSCNEGDDEHPWVAGSSAQHPVIAMNFYRLADGRFEQIGMSWVKHSFCAVSETTCGDCQPNAGCPELGIGCADTYSMGTNANQFNLGPRSEINPTTGVHAHPYAAPVGPDEIRGRIQVPTIADVDPTLNPGALYCAEAHYVGEQDADWGNQNNNVSHRKFIFLNPTSWTAVSADGPTQMYEPAIMAWAAATIESVQVDGLYYVGHLATDNGDGTWHYEYAIYNMNSDRAAGSFSVPVPECVTVSNVGFHDIDYHSGDGEGLPGENYDGTDWSSAYAGGLLTWSTVDHATNASANALRWGTLYNFRFDADAPPAALTADGVLGLFNPGMPASAPVALTVPATPAPSCASDCDFVVSPGGCPDGQIDVSDLLAVLALWGTSGGCDIDGSGTVDVGDILAVLGDWGGCS